MVAVSERYAVRETEDRAEEWASVREYDLREYDLTDAHAPPWPRLVREVAVEVPASRVQGLAPETAVPCAVPADAKGEDPATTVRTAAETPGAGPDPADELFLLGERCAEAYLQADALQYRAMRLLAEFHHREGWRDTGFGSTAEWLAWRIGIRPGAARERLRTALADLPFSLRELGRRSGVNAGNHLKFYTYLFTPKGFDDAGKLPLLVLPHGGVHADFTTYYAHIVRELVTQGYIVVAPEYRGSTGYGERFRGLNRGDISGRDWVDINSGVDHLVDANSEQTHFIELQFPHYVVIVCAAARTV